MLCNIFSADLMTHLHRTSRVTGCPTIFRETPNEMSFEFGGVVLCRQLSSAEALAYATTAFGLSGSTSHRFYWSQ